MSDSIIERLRKHYTGRIRKEVSNPCITAREAIEIANHISALEQPCNCELVVSLREEIAALRVIARSAAQEEETKLDENQFITQQSRIVKLAALSEAGYLKEKGDE